MLGAGSGVGQAAMQIARLHGARVIATAGSDEKLAERAGARRLRGGEPHHGGRSGARCARLTNGRGVDVVVEHVGAATWEASVRSLARGGRLVTCGATTGHDARMDLRFLFGRQLSLLGSYMGTKGRAAPRRAVLLRGDTDAGGRRGLSRSPRPPRPTAGSRRGRRSGRSSSRSA